VADALVASHPGGEPCVSDLTGAFQLSQPTISHHLKVLHEAGLLERDTRGTQALASLSILIGYRAT
jgi:ArsR family transcriptional regulator, arsenate/arsenite/antimonite-responsive transcriptional repressor